MVANGKEMDNAVAHEANDAIIQQDNVGLPLQHTTYITWMVRIWILPLCLSVVLWIYLRVTYHRVLQHWQSEMEATHDSTIRKEMWSTHVRSRIFELRMKVSCLSM